MSGQGRTPSDPEPTGPQAQGPDFAPPGGDATQVVPGHPAPDSTSVLAQAGGTTVQPVAGHAPPAQPPRKPRSRTVMIAVISVLAVLAVLIVGDRVANAVAQNVLAGQLQSELSTPTKPEVSIGGFPFITQVLGGSFSSVEVNADDATVKEGSNTVAIARLDATLTGIMATDRYQSIVADRGEASALVDWTAISTLAGHQVSYVADDRMRIDFSVPIGRLSIDGFITGRPQLDVEAQTISVADPEVKVASVEVPQAVVDAVSRIVLQPIPIQDLPYDISVTGLTVQPDGVVLSGTGQDIPLRGR
jgi:LmeA-like phospholipid-binding